MADDLPTLKKLLGHAQFATTANCVAVTRERITGVRNPQAPAAQS